MHNSDGNIIFIILSKYIEYIKNVFWSIKRAISSDQIPQGR